MSLITLAGASVPGVTGNAVFGVVQYEYTTLAQDGTTSMYGKLPAPYGILTLNQDTSSGDLRCAYVCSVDCWRPLPHGYPVYEPHTLPPPPFHLSLQFGQVRPLGHLGCVETIGRVWNSFTS